MKIKSIHIVFCFVLFCTNGLCQDLAYNDIEAISYQRAYELADSGDYKSAKDTLVQFLSKKPENNKARILLASTYSWIGYYNKAREEFNKVTSVERLDRNIWISAIKNELYAKNEATALGLANKALFYLEKDDEIERLKSLALNRSKNRKYPELGWHNSQETLGTSNKGQKTNSKKENKEKKEKSVEKEKWKNRVGVHSTVTVFSERYDPVVFSSVSFKHKTPYGSIIPKVNYTNRNGKHGLQYNVDLYPKFRKGLYAFLSYGYSDATIFSKHRMAGDLYMSLPGAFEFSAGGRYTITRNGEVKALTNSIGHYRGNYYISLRSFITPRPDQLTRISGNILVRKYLKDSENYMGINFGMGYSPRLEQFISNDQLLAETLLYIESQRLNLEYQFTKNKSQNIYKARMGVRRQEIASDTRGFFWGVMAGLIVSTKF
jgi:YaiO family outer membrane protein